MSKYLVRIMSNLSMSLVVEADSESEAGVIARETFQEDIPYIEDTVYNNIDSLSENPEISNTLVVSTEEL